MDVKINTTNLNTILPNYMFIQLAIQQKQKQKEENADIWKDSPYKHIVKFQLNNIGNIGETFIQNICDTCQIQAQVGNGLILNKSIKIKTSHRCSSTPTFQHELGETPWKTEFMAFIDIAPMCIYLTIFKNFDEELYKSGAKCGPCFPTKTVTWRNGRGVFTLDTTIKTNEANIIKGHTFRFDDNINLNLLKTFILLKFNKE